MTLLETVVNVKPRVEGNPFVATVVPVTPFTKIEAEPVANVIKEVVDVKVKAEVAP